MAAEQEAQNQRSPAYWAAQPAVVRRAAGQGTPQSGVATEHEPLKRALRA